MFRKVLTVLVTAAVFFTNTGIASLAAESSMAETVEVYEAETEAMTEESEDLEFSETAAESESITETESETEFESATEIESETESESATEIESVTELETEAELESADESELQTEAEVQIENLLTTSEAELFSYTENTDGTLTVTGYIGTEFKDLNIPAEINGKSVTAIGDKAFINGRFSGNLTIPESVTSIGAEAFCRCYYLKGTLELPPSLTSIADSAFEYCTGLEGTLKLPDTLQSIGDSAFEACGNLTGNLVIPGGVSVIGEDAFSGCRGFTGDLLIPDNVTQIGSKAFSGCSSMDGMLKLPEKMTDIGEYAFWNCSFTGELVIPEGITTIRQYVFSGCDFSGTLMIPEEVTSIRYRAFADCSGFTGSLMIPESVTDIGEWAFAGCSGLSGNLKLPSAITCVARGAFENCSGFDGTLLLPDGLTAIDIDAFSGCSGFSGNLQIPAGVEYIDSMAFYNCSGFTGNLELPAGVSLGQSTFENCSGFSGDLIIPENTEIGWSTFKGCTGFDGSLTLSEGVYIDNYAFQNCSGLNGTLTILDGPTRIGSHAFENCAGLDGTVVIPQEVINIGEAVFHKCNEISRIDLPDSVKYISAKAFGEMNALTDVYYAGSESDWEKISINADNQALNNARIHFDYDPVFTGGDVLYFNRWDSDEQIAWFGRGDQKGYQVTEQTDFGFAQNAEELLGKYVLVEYSDNSGEYPEELIKVTEVETNIGILKSIEDGSAAIGENTYTIPAGWILPKAEVGDYALVHVLEGMLVGMETLCAENGILTYWDLEKGELTIEPLDTSFHQRTLVRSPLVDEEAGSVFGETGETRSVIRYLRDSDHFWYYAEMVPVMWVKDIEDQHYTGKAVKPQVEVYDGNKRLTENVDYTISYKNNIKANDASNTKTAPTVTVSGKGNYSEKEILTFKILPQTLSGDETEISDITQKYTGKIQKPVPTVKWNGKKLKNKTDFEVEYPNTEEGAYQNSGEYVILIRGKGNFAGERHIAFKITENKLISKVSVSKIVPQLYTGSEIIPEIIVKEGKNILEQGKDYSITYENNVDIGTAKIILCGQGAYSGEKVVSFKITGGSIGKAKVIGLNAGVEYTGKPIEQECRLTVTTAGVVKELTEGVDYTAKWMNNQAAGKAKVTFTGINGYSGTLTKTFTIKPFVISQNEDCAFKVQCEKETFYAKSGSKPKVEVTFEGTLLEEGRDYKLSYKNNQAVNDGSNLKKMPTVTVTGKGNFKGSCSVDFRITEQDLGTMNATVPDKVFQKKANAWKSVLTITDMEGKKLSAGKDYEKNLTYTYKNDTLLEDGTLRTAGSVLQKNDILPSETEVLVTAVGKGNYAGKLTGEYRITKESISKAKVFGPAYEYTGKKIMPGEEMFYVLVGGRLLDPSDYEIVAYSNNIKAGNASVTIRGTGNYGGFKTASFKIVSRSIISWWKSLFR